MPPFPCTRVSGEDHGGNNGQWKQTQEHIHKVDGNYHLILCTHKGHETGTYIRNRKSLGERAATREKMQEESDSQENKQRFEIFSEMNTRLEEHGRN